MGTVDVAYHMPRALVDDVSVHMARLTLTTVDAGYGTETINAYKLSAEFLSVPRFYGLSHFGPPTTLQTSQGDALIHLEFRGTLGDVQQRALTSLEPTPESATTPPFGGIIVLPCGFGKTVTALAYACRMQTRTLVVVAKTFLADQWEQQVQKFTNATVGRIQQNEFRVGEITIALVQTLIAREYDLDAFGLVIFDECHHMAAKCFSAALWKLRAARILGLSATPERSDGLTQLLYWSMGDIKFRASRSATEHMRVHQRVYDGAPVREVTGRDEKINLSAMVTLLAADRARTLFVSGVVRDAVAEGHCVIVLSDRIAQLKALHAMLEGLEVGFYIGATPAAERRRVEAEARVVLSSYSMAKEGLDIPRLSCLVMATPKSEVEQAVGRIQRPCAQKMTPLVEDIVDAYSIFSAMRWKRRRFFKAQGCAPVPL